MGSWGKLVRMVSAAGYELDIDIYFRLFLSDVFSLLDISATLSTGFDFRLVVRRISSLLIHREFNFINLQSVVLLFAFSVTSRTQ